MKKEMHCIMKKLLSILLSLVLLSSLCAAFAEEDVIDVSIVVYQRSNQGNADDIWWWDYCREQFGINFTVTQVTSASDYKSISFASGDMPDVFYQMFMSSGAAGGIRRNQRAAHRPGRRISRRKSCPTSRASWTRTPPTARC